MFAIHFRLIIPWVRLLLHGRAIVLMLHGMLLRYVLRTLVQRSLLFFRVDSMTAFCSVRGNCKRGLKDNPRRLWLKIHYPNRLRKVYNFSAGKKGHQYTAVGNTFLVTYPERLQVRCHRNLTEEQIQEEVATYLKEARRGTVLISPFISPAEKAVYEACYREKLPMIHIVNRGLDGRFIYPSGRDLSGCSEGFLLVLAPYADYSAETAAKRITRAECLNLNDFAADLGSIALKCAERDERASH